MKIEAPELSSFPNLRHAFFTREGGVSEGIYASLNGGLGSADDPGHVATNRARMADELGVRPDAFVSLHQIHSANVVTVREPWAIADRPKADAAVTDRHDLAIAIATADCGPVLFADGRAGVIGAAHAGWKGALGGVLDATVDAMETLGAERDRIVAVLGPTIGPKAYEVGPEFVERFRAADPENDRFFRPGARPDRAMFDLPAYVLGRLSRLGLAEAVDLGLCTYSDEARFFSFRRTTHRGEPDYGRMLSAIATTR